MPGPVRKPTERSQGHRKRPHLTVHGGGKLELPKAPRGLLKATRQRWSRYWGSPLAQLVEPETDLSAIERLFTLYDERERAYRAYRKERLVLGHAGQQVLNPLGRQLSVFDAEIRQLEDRLGLTPRARLQLGIVYGEVKRTLEELNRALEIDDQDPREH